MDLSLKVQKLIKEINEPLDSFYWYAASKIINKHYDRIFKRFMRETFDAYYFAEFIPRIEEELYKIDDSLEKMNVMIKFSEFVSRKCSRVKVNLSEYFENNFENVVSNLISLFKSNKDIPDVYFKFLELYDNILQGNGYPNVIRSSPKMLGYVIPLIYEKVKDDYSSDFAETLQNGFQYINKCKLVTLNINKYMEEENMKYRIKLLELKVEKLENLLNTMVDDKLED